jgi:hypothetical protein
MKKVMQILDLFELPGLGLVISGTNSNLNDLTNDQIKKYVGNEVLIKKSDNSSVEISDIKVDIGTSLIGQKNINICLPDGFKASELEANATVFSK